MIRLAPVFRLAVPALLFVGPAMAGGFSVSPVARVPAMAGFPGQTGASVATTPGTMSFGGAGMNVSNADGVSVQTNINASRNVQAGSNVAINETINGVQVGYGMGGDFLGGTDAQAQAVWAQKQALYQQLEDEASLAVQVWSPGN